jgi:hypothetical protein
VAVNLTFDDLTPFAPNISEEQAEAMIADALALAARIAPCLDDADLEAGVAAAAKAVLRGAVLRWYESGSGAYTQQQAGPFQITSDNRQGRKSMFWPSEISELAGLCSGTGTARKAFMVDMIPEEGS